MRLREKGEVLVTYCTKCRHNTVQQNRALVTAVGQDGGTVDYEDLGLYYKGRDYGLPLACTARQCLVCGRYFGTAKGEVQLKMR